MKKRIKLYKRFISIFLAVMMIYSMVFTGVKVSAATTDSNNGDWSSANVTLQNTSEAQLMVRTGDIDNFGFGWKKSTATINPFSGVETNVHSFPFTPGSSDPQGTDRIMSVTGYNSRYTTVGTNTDGYTRSSTSYAKTVKPVVLSYSQYLSGVSIQNATIQMFLDDFQPGKAHGVTQGTVQYTATINGVEIPELSTVINNLDQSGPIGKLITFQIPQRYLDLIRTGTISLKFDDVNSCTGDGYAIDFVKLLINKTNSTTNTATITGNVKDTNNSNIAGATVSAGGVVTATTDSSGNYTLNNVPAGQAIVTASKSGYNSSTVTIPTVIAGGGYIANFTLTSSTPPTRPTISATPTTPTNTKVTATIGYSSDSTIRQYRIDIGGATGEWKVYNSAFDVTDNCTIEAQGINKYGNSSQISSYIVSNIDKIPPTLTLTLSTATNSKAIITATASDNVAVASITKPDTTVFQGNSTTYTVNANGTYTFKATDTAGNVTTQSITISNMDTTAPLAPVITAPKDGTVTNNNKPTINGTAEANSTVKVYDGTTLIGTVTADGSGRWTLTPATVLSEGTHAITATATDAAGNVSPVSNTVNITIDTRVPSAPVITDPKDGTVTNNNTPAISGTAEANSTVKVYDGTTLIGKVTADGSGNWTLTPTAALLDGAHVITATSTDAAGNVSPVSNEVNITIDSTAALAPVITDPRDGTLTKNSTPTINGTSESNSMVNVYDGGTVIGIVTADGSGNWTLTLATPLSDGVHAITATATDTAGNISPVSNTVNITIDTTPPVLTLSRDATDLTNETVNILATATDNIEVANITKPDNTVVTGSSTTYTVNSNGTYTFAATDTAGNMATQSININDIVVPSTNNTSLPNISASLKSVTPNPAKSSDDITVKYDISTVPFSLSGGMINEAEVLVDMSQEMKSNQRFSELQNGFVNQIINDSNLSGIKLGVIGYSDSVYIGTRSTYSDPKSCVMKQTDENLSNIDKTNFLPLYNLNDANTKDGYRQFYQNGYIYNNISSNNQREFGSALKAADNVLTNYGTSGAKKAIIIVSSGNLTYSDAQIESIKSKGYKIIILDISNSNSTNIKDTYMKLCGNEFGIDGNYYKGTFNDGANYNSVDTDMRNVDASLKGVTGVTTLSINDAKLNIDLGDNFKIVDGGVLQGTGKICTVNVPQINFVYNSTMGQWEQSGTVEVTFKVKSEIGKYGSLGFGLYTNADNTTHTNSSSISYTNFWNVATNKIIETPTINITIDTKVQSAPVITGPEDGTVTSDNTPTITGTAEANSTVKVYDGETLIGTVTADGSGNWTLIPTTALSDGSHAITATSIDAAGNVSAASNTVNITIDSTAPLAPVITGPEDGTVTSDNTPTITGTAEANSTVKVYDRGTLIGTVTADGSGNWTLTPPTALVDGTHSITATATDALGNVSSESNVVNITIYTFESSIIEQHGIYSGSGSGIVSERNVTNEMPITMAMIVDAKSASPVINWHADDTTKVTVDNTSFKEYKISEDGTISYLKSLTLNGNGEITGTEMTKDEKYIILYTITPVGSGGVALTAEADGTTPKTVTLTILGEPDLF